MKTIYDKVTNSTFTVSDEEFESIEEQYCRAKIALKSYPNIIPHIVFNFHIDWIYKSDEDYSELIDKRNKELDAILNSKLDS